MLTVINNAGVAVSRLSAINGIVMRKVFVCCVIVLVPFRHSLILTVEEVLPLVLVRI